MGGGKALGRAGPPLCAGERAAKHLALHLALQLQLLYWLLLGSSQEEEEGREPEGGPTCSFIPGLYATCPTYGLGELVPQSGTPPSRDFR